MDCNDASGIYSIHAVFACISVVNHDLFKNTQLLEVNYNVLIIIAKYCVGISFTTALHSTSTAFSA